MSEYISTPTTNKGGNATGDGALDGSQSGCDTPVMEDGTAVPFPNSDAAPSVSAGPIGDSGDLEIETHGREVYPDDHTCGEPGCLKVFATAQQLQGHARSAKHKSYHCKCGYVRSSKGELNYHVAAAKRDPFANIAHGQKCFDQAHTCAENGCRRVFANGCKLEEHAKTTRHKAFQCICTRGFSKLYSLSRHIDESRDDWERKYKCPLEKLYRHPEKDCPFSFKRLNHLEQHLRRRFPGGHSKTAEEAQVILLPFRKRKPGPFRSVLAVRTDATTNAPHDSPLPNPEDHSTTPDFSSSNSASPRVASLAVTTDAIPSTQNAQTMMPTDGPAHGLATSPELPGYLTANHVGDGGFPPTTSVSSFQMPKGPENLATHAGEASGLSSPPVNRHPSSQSADGGRSTPFTGAYPYGYASPVPGSFNTGGFINSAMWAPPSGVGSVDGFGMQYNMPPMAPGFGTFNNPNGAANFVCPPMVSAPLHFAPLNQGQMGWFPKTRAVQSLMTDMPGYHSAFQNNVATTTWTPTYANTGAWQQPLNSSTDGSLYGTSTAGFQLQADSVLAGEDLNVFDFAESIGSYNS